MMFSIGFKRVEVDVDLDDALLLLAELGDDVFLLLEAEADTRFCAVLDGFCDGFWVLGAAFFFDTVLGFFAALLLLFAGLGADDGAALTLDVDTVDVPEVRGALLAAIMRGVALEDWSVIIYCPLQLL